MRKTTTLTAISIYFDDDNPAHVKLLAAMKATAKREEHSFSRVVHDALRAYTGQEREARATTARRTVKRALASLPPDLTAAQVTKGLASGTLKVDARGGKVVILGE